MATAITDYMAVTARNTEDLSELVQIHISEGWQPLGVVTMDEDNLAQTMVKYTSGKENV